MADWLPGSKNDKTQAMGDELFEALRTGSLHPDKAFTLYTDDGETIEVKGLYCLVDGGYHQWRCLQCPLKHAVGDDAAAWSERIESTRKSVECLFGRLKKRFRILRLPFLMREPDRISHTFKACCALHNMLLRHDKLNTMGRQRGDWLPMRAVLARQATEAERAKHVVRAPYNEDSCNSQREPNHALLREQLITHYTQACRRREIGWLCTAAAVRPRAARGQGQGDQGDVEESEHEEYEAEEEEDLVYPDTDTDDADEED